MDSCVRGFHVYKDIWIPATSKMLSCERENGNVMDPFAVAIKKGSDMFHARFQPHASFSYKRVGSLPDCNPQYSFDLPQGGLQIVCKLVFQSHDMELMAKVKKLVQTAPPIHVQLEQPAYK